MVMAGMKLSGTATRAATGTPGRRRVGRRQRNALLHGLHPFLVNDLELLELALASQVPGDQHHDHEAEHPDDAETGIELAVVHSRATS